MKDNVSNSHKMTVKSKTGAVMLKTMITQSSGSDKAGDFMKGSNILIVENSEV